jgi:predicted DCC family thiol-disulfide oxidoreductase YuxK
VTDAGIGVAPPLDPLDEAVAPLTVLFDGECPFCRWTANRLRRWDRDGSLRLRPLQDVGDQPVLAQLLDGFDLGRSIHAVDSAGRVAAGGEAVLAIVAVLPGGRPVATFVGGVGLWRLVVRFAYRVVDRVRPLLSDLGFDGPLIREGNPLFDVPADNADDGDDEHAALDLELPPA